MAALNHPAVLALYDVGEADGVAFLVTELLEGETLRARLGRGAVSCEQAVEWGASVADALAAAHAAGIVHRDLKPENLFLTRDGRLKVLDFGLAKDLTATAGGLRSRHARGADGRRHRARNRWATCLPSRRAGHPVDGRSDIFSLGCVLYEALTGHQAFGGKTAQDHIAAVLRDEPPDCRLDPRGCSPRVDARRGALPGQGARAAVPVRERPRFRPALLRARVGRGRRARREGRPPWATRLLARARRRRRRAGRRLLDPAFVRSSRAGGARAHARDEPGGEPRDLARREVRGVPRVRGRPHGRVGPVRGWRARGQPHGGARPRDPEPGHGRGPRDLARRELHRGSRGSPGPGVFPARGVAHPRPPRGPAPKAARPGRGPALVRRREEHRLHAAGSSEGRRDPGGPRGRNRGARDRRSHAGAPLPRAHLVARRCLGLFQPRAHAQQRRAHRDLARTRHGWPSRAGRRNAGRGARPGAHAGRERPDLCGRPVGRCSQPVVASAPGRAREAPHPRGGGLPRAPNLAGRTAPRLRGPHERRVAPRPRPGRELGRSRPRVDGRRGRGRSAFVRPERADRVQLRPGRDARHLDERRRRRRPPTPDLGRRDRLPSCDLARREPRGLRLQPRRPPRPVAGVRGGRSPAIPGAGGRRRPTVVVPGRSEPRLRGRREGPAGRAVGRVRRRWRAGRRPGREGSQPGLVSGLGPDRLLHVVGVGRAPDRLHEQPGRSPPGAARRRDLGGRRRGLLLERGPARDRQSPRDPGKRGSSSWTSRADTSAAWSGCRPSRGSAGSPGPPTTRASSTASSSTRAGSCSSTALRRTRASGA